MDQATNDVGYGHITVRQMIEEVRRESAMRRSLYDKWVRAGRMTRAEADGKIDLMMAIERRLTRTAHL